MAIGVNTDEKAAATSNWAGRISARLDSAGALSRWSNIVGITVLFIMVCLTTADVLLRFIFNSPIKGAFDIISVMLVVIIFLGIAHTQNEKGHVAVDLLTKRLSPKPKIILETIINIISMGVFAIVIWRTYSQFSYFLNAGSLSSQYLKIPSAPFAAVILFGCILFLIILIRDFFSNIDKGIKLFLRSYEWLLIFVVPVLFLTIAWFWVQPDLWSLDPLLIGALGIIFSLLFISAGMPVYMALFLISILFIGHIQGINPTFSQLGIEIYRNASSYDWVAIAFFTFMGYIFVFSRFGEDIYVTAYKWLGRLPGGLAIATITASAALAAIVGSGMSTVVALGSIALPEMRRYKYDDRISAGSVVSGATLGPIIPPSQNFIIYALLTQQSIGRLFMAGIFPGVLLALMFMVYVYAACRFKPELGMPAEEKVPLKEKMSYLKFGGPVIFLFVLVVGGIYIGIFTATEGAGIGCAGAVIYALCMKRLTWSKLKSSLLESGKTTSMIFLILIGGMLFSRFVAYCNLDDILGQYFSGLALPPSLIIIIILIIFFALGFVIDMLPLLIIGVPIVHPIAIALGFDPIWFTVMMVIIIGVGTITPPFGISLFTLKSVIPDLSFGSIYRGAVAFSVMSVVVTGIIFAVPQIATWLPSIMY